MRSVMLALAIAATLAVAAQADQQYVVRDLVEGGGPAAKGASFRLMSADNHKYVAANYWPRSQDPWLSSLKSRSVFYTENEMPKGYQDGITGDSGFGNRQIGPQGLFFQSAYQNVAPGRDPHGNPNMEFPWGGPAGTDHAKGVFGFRFIALPDGKAIRYWTQQSDGLSVNLSPIYQWAFPAGTTFGELLTLKDAEGYSRTFEVRTRTKRPTGSWEPKVFRPAASVKELNLMVAAFGSGPQVEAFLAHNHEDGRIVRMRNNHKRKIFSRVAIEDRLPPLPKTVVDKVLESGFKEADHWVNTDRGDCYAPTVAKGYSIVPPGYEGHFLRVSTRACMDCHRTTGMHADRMDPRPNRDWYGHVRGSDGIFSFHIFEPGRGVQFRKELVRAGVLKHWDAQ